MADGTSPLGGRHPRPDAEAKATGRARYTGDLHPAGMLHAALAVAESAPGLILSLDAEAARHMEGVEAVVTPKELPGPNRIGVIFPDQPLLAEEQVRMVGERIALVAARTPEAAWEAARAVRLELDPLPGVHDPVEALEPGAPRVHQDGNLVHTFHVRRGRRGQPSAPFVVEAEYHVGGQEHAYLEPQACLAIPEGRSRITIVASCQCPFYIQQGVARVLGLPLAAVRVEQGVTGGAFGGKEDYPTEPAACAAVLAWMTGRPVGLTLPRELDIAVTSKRHAMIIRHRWGADRDGRLRFAEVESFVDAGAYVGLSTVVAERANVSAIGPYRVPSVSVDTHVVSTNNLFGGAYRGFGAPQVTFAAEATMDRLARATGLEPVEIRRRNLLDDEHRRTCTGQNLTRPVLAARCLDEALRLSDAWKPPKRRAAHLVRGRGIGLVLYGVNLHHGGQHLDRSSAVVMLQPDGSVIVRVGLTEMGQGLLAAAQTVTATALGIAPDRIQVWQPDTTTVGDSGPTVASRGAHAAGLAILDAVARLRKRLDPVAAELLGCSEKKVELVGGLARVADDPKRTVLMDRVAAEMAARRIEAVASGWYRSRTRPYDPETGVGNPYESYAMACHVARVAVDRELGVVRVEHVAAAHDVGRVLHRDGVEGQIEGGIVQAMGWALTEALHLHHGRLLNPNFTDYLIPTSADVPDIDIALIEEGSGAGPYGSKGIGEPSFIPAAAAIRNAVVDALGLEIDHLPLTPPVVVEALGEDHPFSFVVA